MTRNKIFLVFAMLARIGTGLASLLVLARGLGPTDYGFVATVFAYASVAALLTDFGLPVLALRDIGAEPSHAGELIAACIRLKNLLVSVVTVAAVVTLSVIGLDAQLFWSSIMLYASIIALSYGELVLVALRGIGRYDAEAYATAIGAVVFVAIVGSAALASPDILPVAVALLSARLFQAALSFFAVRRHIKLANCLFGPVLDSIAFATNSSALALDSVLTTLSAQLDVIFVSATLGLEAAGIYQVAARLANYVLLPIQILAGVYMPALALQHRTGAIEFRAINRRMRREFAATGLILGTCVVLFIPWVSSFLFGADFGIHISVWIVFGGLVFLRFSAAALGVALTAQRRVWYRVAGQGAALLTVGLFMYPALSLLGLLGAPLVMCVATIITLLIYWRAGSAVAEGGVQ